MGNRIRGFPPQAGLRHAVATVILPRAAVIVRPLALPGVSNKDLDSAVRFQMDGLHPYSEDDVYSAWTRLPGTSIVVVAVAPQGRSRTLRGSVSKKPASAFADSLAPRPPSIPRYAFLVRRRRRSCWLSTIPRASSNSTAKVPRVRSSPPASKPRNDRAASLGRLRAAHSLRTPNPFLCLRSLERRARIALRRRVVLGLPAPESRLESSAGGAASGRLASALGSSRCFWSGGAGARGRAGRFPRLRKPQVSQVAASSDRRRDSSRPNALGRHRQTGRRSYSAASSFWTISRRHPRADMDVLAELTRILPPPTWLNLMQISPKQVSLGGETPEAAPLLSLLDSSRLFEGSEFQAAPLRLPGAGGETFRIRTNRRGVK